MGQPPESVKAPLAPTRPIAPEWARNLRAAGRGRLRRRGRTQALTAIEVDGEERDRVIARYLRGSGPLKNDFYRRPAGADHPAFRLEAIA